MRTVAGYAERILAATVKGRTGDRVFPRYAAFNRGPPSWWTRDIVADDWGKVLGVHESVPNQRAGALVVTAIGLALLGPDTVEWIAYGDVAGWDRLSKEPLSESLIVTMRDGRRIALPFPNGGAFAFVQFLLGATRVWNAPEGVPVLPARSPSDES